MLKLYPFFSSSSGNMYYIKSDLTSIIIDLGVSYKKIKDALTTSGNDISNVNAVFITHEHSDHIKGLNMFVKKNPNTPIYSSEGTYNYLCNILNKAEIPSDSLQIIDTNNPITINDVTIQAFDTIHDAVNPVGYKMSSGKKTLTIATDLGTMTDDVFCHLCDSSFSVIESNYDKNMLYAGSYPFYIKRRIAGPYGHLSNEDSGQVILKLAENGKRNFLLSHMSENNNMPILAKEAICSTLSLAGFDISEFDISVAPKEFTGEVYLL